MSTTDQFYYVKQALDSISRQFDQLKSALEKDNEKLNERIKELEKKVK
jgi:cell division septum initiation protein DivIVA